MWTATSQKIPIEKTPQVDKEILSLFPSLDYETETSLKSKSQKEKRLNILRKTAEKISTSQDKKFITQYDLTNAKASPRFGSGAANQALKLLDAKGLLTANHIKNEKGTDKILRTLTAKGIIACLALSEFQSVEKVRILLSNTSKTKLSLLIKIYNEGYARGKTKNTTTPALSPLVSMVKQFHDKGRGLDLERTTEDAMADELQRLEENTFVESQKVDLFESAGTVLSLSLLDHKTEGSEQFQTFLKTLKGKYTPQEQAQVLEQGMRLTRSVIFALTSPEIIAFIMTKTSKNTEEKVQAIIDDVRGKLHECALPSKNDLENFDYILKLVRDSVIKQLSDEKNLEIPNKK